MIYIGSDSDVNGVLAEADFENAENLDLTMQENKVHYYESGLFEGDIMVDDGYGEAINIAARKWPKSADGLVYVPFSFPPTASEDEKSAIARTVTEFKNKTCIRYDLSILRSPIVFSRNIYVVIKFL